MSNMPGLPIDQVRAFKQQGLSNDQIIQSLQRDGFTSAQIFEALNQVEMGSSSPTSRPPVPPAPQPQSAQGVSTEELVEAIIDEKWNELVKDITAIIEWKNQAQSVIASLQQQINDLKDQFDKVHQALIGKINEYDKNILDVGAEVKAMEKVFSKVLPVFTENVAQLTKITNSLKGLDKSE